MLRYGFYILLHTCEPDIAKDNKNLEETEIFYPYENKLYKMKKFSSAAAANEFYIDYLSREFNHLLYDLIKEHFEVENNHINFYVNAPEPEDWAKVPDGVDITISIYYEGVINVYLTNSETGEEIKDRDQLLEECYGNEDWLFDSFRKKLNILFEKTIKGKEGIVGISFDVT